MQALSEGNRSIGCRRSETACASFLFLRAVLSNKTSLGNINLMGFHADRRHCLRSRYRKDILLHLIAGTYSRCASLRAVRSVMFVDTPCICFSRVPRPSCMKPDFIRPLRAWSSSTASAYRCDCLLSPACYSCAQPRFHLSAYQGRFYNAAKHPVCRFPASLHSHVALNRMFMLFCGVVVRSHDHLASILASLSSPTYSASTLEPAVRRPALEVFFPSSNTKSPDPIVNEPVDLPLCYSYAAPFSLFPSFEYIEGDE
jgi:hypothetical protein